MEQGNQQQTQPTRGTGPEPNLGDYGGNKKSKVNKWTFFYEFST